MIDTKNDSNGQELHVFQLQLDTGEGHVKSASVHELENISGLESRHFADPASRSFPTHTKEATERSIFYFFGNMLKQAYDSVYPIEKTESRLKKAARFWDVADRFYAVKRAYVEAGSEELERAPVEYALNGHLPISTPDQVIKSAKALITQRDKVCFSKRAEAAMKILKAATTLDVDDEELGQVATDLQKMAGLKVRDRASIGASLKQRGMSFELAGVDAEVYKMAADTIKTCSYSDMDYLCGLLDAYEHTTKAARVKVGPIEDMFFDDKLGNGWVDLANGSTVDLDRVKSAQLAPFYAVGTTVPLEVVDGKGLVDLKKAARYLESMSAKDCDVFMGALKQCRI